MKRILPLSLFCLSVSVSSADTSWRMHPAFDEEVTHVIDTPDFVYFTSRQLPKNNGLTENYISLFRYDKTGEEIIPLSTDNLLSSTILYDVMRSPRKGYVMTVGSDYSIDFLYDNGKVESLPDYKLSSLSYPKNVNSLTPDAERNRVYMATNFGYVAIDDKKREIAESRTYGSPLQSVARIGDKIIAIEGWKIISAPIDEPRFSLSDYKKVGDFFVPLGLYPLSEDKCVFITHGGAPLNLHVLSLDEAGEVVVGEPIVGDFFGMEYNDAGLLVCTHDIIIQFNKDGSYTAFQRPESDKEGTMFSANTRDFWSAAARKGLRSYRLNDDGWQLTHDYMLPDSPSPFMTTCFAMHPEKGLLVTNFGLSRENLSYAGNSPMLLSSYKDGRWENLSAAYTAPELPTVIYDPYGIAIDPDNPDYIYASSLHSGLARLSLSNPDDVIHFVHPSHVDAGKPNAVILAPDIISIDNWSCSFSQPRFDAYGNLWSLHANFDLGEEMKLSAYCWEAADRKATTSVNDVRLPKLLYIPGFSPNHYETLVPLLGKKNKNYLLYSGLNYYSNLSVIDTNGTPTDGSDDKIATFTSFIDQDGNHFDVNYVSGIYEDPATGYVWIGHGEGVFYFDPAELLAGSLKATRIKVARNDGTNLADYLLNAVPVKDIVVDGDGNKWFATNGAGIVCTSPDGRTILRELTAENSSLPDNEVGKLGYKKDSNSLIISTMKGMAEYFIPKTSGSGGEETKVRVYPNPVRPDYSGYITIDGLEDGALVKIVDGGGNIVKELGPVNGNSVQWDATNHQFKRVSSGVYFILTSASSGDSSYANVGKVLMIN
ncbi:MAG: T9SS type A sorting domain-containing protein [Muribaculaceae bacterium]|nr:T9SS type A sorting domain-containing protein [Muribaculaceae bacterium]